jgi:hypothetical protein
MDKDQIVKALVKGLDWQLVAYAEGPHYVAFDGLYGSDVEAADEATCDAIDAARRARIAAALDLDKIAGLVEAASEASDDLGAWVSHKEHLEREGFDVGYSEKVRKNLWDALAAFLGDASEGGQA